MENLSNLNEILKDAIYATLTISKREDGDCLYKIEYQRNIYSKSKVAYFFETTAITFNEYVNYLRNDDFNKIQKLTSYDAVVNYIRSLYVRSLIEQASKSKNEELVKKYEEYKEKNDTRNSDGSTEYVYRDITTTNEYGITVSGGAYFKCQPDEVYSVKRVEEPLFERIKREQIKNYKEYLKKAIQKGEER